jgi:hypothetical protein
LGREIDGRPRKGDKDSVPRFPPVGDLFGGPAKALHRPEELALKGLVVLPKPKGRFLDREPLQVVELDGLPVAFRDQAVRHGRIEVSDRAFFGLLVELVLVLEFNR